MSAALEVTAVGDLRWNIKQSFRDYVGELPDGEESWTGEIGGIDRGDLVFPSVGVSVDPETSDARILKFGGAVRFAGYRGMLRVDISDPWLEFTSDGAALTANIAPTGVAERRAVVAQVQGQPARVGDRSWEWSPQSTTLSAAGATVLGSVYPPGTDAAGFDLHVSCV